MKKLIYLSAIDGGGGFTNKYFLKILNEDKIDLIIYHNSFGGKSITILSTRTDKKDDYYTFDILATKLYLYKLKEKRKVYEDLFKFDQGYIECSQCANCYVYNTPPYKNNENLYDWILSSHKIDISKINEMPILKSYSEELEEYYKTENENKNNSLISNEKEKKIICEQTTTYKEIPYINTKIIILGETTETEYEKFYIDHINLNVKKTSSN